MRFIFKHCNYFYPQCDGIKKDLTEMIRCCESFEFSLSPEVIGACAKECLAGKSDECCYVECQMNHTGIYDLNTEQFNKTAFEMLIFYNKNLSTIEMNNVRDSLYGRHCMLEFQVQTGLRRWHCEFPEIALRYIRCILKMIFLRCPNVVDETPKKGYEMCKKFGNLFYPCNETETDTFHRDSQTDKEIKYDKIIRGKL